MAERTQAPDAVIAMRVKVTHLNGTPPRNRSELLMIAQVPADIPDATLRNLLSDMVETHVLPEAQEDVDVELLDVETVNSLEELLKFWHPQRLPMSILPAVRDLAARNREHNG